MNFPSKIISVKNSILYSSYRILENIEDKVRVLDIYDKLKEEIDLNIFIDSLVFLLILEKIDINDEEIERC